MLIASPSFQIKTIQEMNLASRSILMRLDFNVPLGPPDAQGVRAIEDDSRIQEALPTLRFAQEKGAKLIVISHLGRPDGKRKPEFSLEPIARRLASLLGHEVTLADDCIGDGIELMAQSLKGGQILLLENLRFHSGEEANDPEFCKRLARLGQAYVTDAFGTAHRKHASTFGVPAIMSERGMGELMAKELKFLDPLLHGPKKPYLAILGGSKVSDKIKTIESLVRNVDGLLIGGLMGHAFLAAQGSGVPPEAKPPKPSDIDAARIIIKEAKKREIDLVLPCDTHHGFDIGSKTIEQFIQRIEKAETIFWNGPLGWFEKPDYARGTFEVAKAIANSRAMKIAGGGETVSAIKKSGFAEHFDHLSTGGGALLEYLEGKGLPGIDVLKLSQRQVQQFDMNPEE
jgi:phosphoglycerate kinase